MYNETLCNGFRANNFLLLGQCIRLHSARMIEQP